MVASPQLYLYDLMLLLLPFAIVWSHPAPGAPRGGPVLAWSAVFWLLAFLSMPFTRAQLYVASALDLGPFALQLATLAILAWGVEVVRRGDAGLASRPEDLDRGHASPLAARRLHRRRRRRAGFHCAVIVKGLLDADLLARFNAELDPLLAVAQPRPPVPHSRDRVVLRQAHTAFRRRWPRSRARSQPRCSAIRCCSDLATGCSAACARYQLNIAHVLDRGPGCGVAITSTAMRRSGSTCRGRIPQPQVASVMPSEDFVWRERRYASWCRAATAPCERSPSRERSPTR